MLQKNRFSKYLIIFFTLFYTVLPAQNYTLSGYITDASSAEGLIGSNIVIKNINEGAVANDYGYYSISLPAGKYQVEANALSYLPKAFEVDLRSDTKLNFELINASTQLNEIVINAEREDKNVESSEMGKVELKMETIKEIPSLFGEIDIMRTMQLLPGVMSAGEGNSGFYVRGGGPDQNLILLDNAVVYNPGHLFGFFSVFNSDAIKNSTLIKGGMPAEYGGRISSVLDINMKEGNMKHWEAEGGIGLISSRLTLQGPIKKDKLSLIVSARRTYIDVITKPFLKKIRNGDFEGNSYFFYDLNTKLNYNINERNHLYLSGYFGRDVFNFKDPKGAFSLNFPWGNNTATLRYNHVFGPQLFMNAAALYNDYRFKVKSDFQDIEFGLNSQVRDFSLSVDCDYYPHVNHSVKFGIISTRHIFTPYQFQGSAGSVDFSADNATKKFANESAIYISDDYALNSWFRINYGLRNTYYQFRGPYDKIVFDYETGKAIDTLYYGHENIKTYTALEPRINLRFLLGSSSSLKAGFTINNQYLHLVSSSTTTLPTDIWVPSTDRTKPQKGFQYSIGYYQNFSSNKFESSVELYYKDMKNQIEFGNKVGDFSTDVEDLFVYGKGWSYGAEFFLKKAKGKLNGWAGYTLSYTKRRFPEINNNNIFPTKYDRRHDLSLVLIYNANKKITLSTEFVYGTGNATTIATGKYFINGQIVTQFSDRNAFRLAPYHRLDFSLTWKIKDSKKFSSDLSFSVYNVYNRKNPFFIYSQIDGDINTITLDDPNIQTDGKIITSAKQVSLFPVLPSITWNFKFK